MFAQLFRSLNSVKKLLAGLLIMHLLLSNALAVDAQDKPSTVTQPTTTEQASSSTVFLPLVANNSQGTSPSNGTTKIQNAGLLSTDGPKQDEPVLTPLSDEQILPSDPVNEGLIKAIQCSTRKWTASQVRELGDTILLDANSGIIYPGALVQGKDLEEGRFTPITIPRAGGKIWLQGLKLAPDAKYSRTLSEMSGSNVKQAIEDILSIPISDTAASAYYNVEQAYSYEQMMFQLRVDARYGLASMKASLKIGTQQKKNYVFAKFVQVFYDVYFEDPELSTSVFRDGENFQDPENQIYPGNTPLYVQKVSYGRMVFFVAESDYSAKDVVAALQGSYDAVVGGAKVESGLTYQEVMERTKIYYAVIGGDAELALQPIDTASPKDMYDKVKGFLSDKTAAKFSPSNPGLPIAYTLRYLSTRDPARMSYSVIYDQNDCQPLLKAAARVTVKFTKVHIINDADPDCFICGSDPGDDIRFNLKVYGSAGAQQTISSSSQDMYSGQDYPIEKVLTVTLNEDEPLRIYVDGTEKDYTSPDDQMGEASFEWSMDTAWGTMPFSNHVMHGKGDGEYNMTYEITVEWIRHPPSLPIGVLVNAHVQGIGWMGWTVNPNSDTNYAGTTGQERRMEAIQTQLFNAPPGMQICYQAHVQAIGWMDEVCGGAIAGTTGEGKRMEAIKIHLVNAPAGVHVTYRAYVQDSGWLPWQSEGDIAGTVGQGKRMEAINIEITEP